ncbi:MAG: DUF4055 domain-containing protein [bacterium]|nr:DUF4055 domain-containing protein [bacterium]
MKVDTEHPVFRAMLPKYGKMADVLAGEDDIKSAGDRYIPALSGQDRKDFDAYVNRGSFFEATGRTVRGLTGTITRKPETVELPENMTVFVKDVTRSGVSISEAIRYTCDEILSYGRQGIFVDHSGVDGAFPYFAFYGARNIINWFPDYPTVENPLQYVVLRENVSKLSTGDPYKRDSIEQVRIIKMNDGQVIAETWQKQKNADDSLAWRLIKTIPLRINGKPWEEIPFIFIGAEKNTPAPEKPPLLGLANLNLTHWRTDVDYRHGLHILSLPTPYAMGFADDVGITLGPGAAITNRDTNAKVGMLEYSGVGINSVRTELNEIKKEMAVMGSRLLEEQPSVAETATGQRLRQAGNVSTLSTIAGQIEQGYTRALKYAARWMRQDESKVSCVLNKDFLDSQLSPQQITVLMQAWQGGGISQDTFIHNLIRGEIVPGSRSIEDEKLMIVAEGDKEFTGV